MILLLYYYDTIIILLLYYYDTMITIPIRVQQVLFQIFTKY